MLDFFKEEELEEYDEPRLNGARELVSNLMANRSCDEEAPALAALRRQIDAEHRKRAT